MGVAGILRKIKAAAQRYCLLNTVPILIVDRAVYRQPSVEELKLRSQFIAPNGIRRVLTGSIRQPQRRQRAGAGSAAARGDRYIPCSRPETLGDSGIKKGVVGWRKGQIKFRIEA